MIGASLLVLQFLTQSSSIEPHALIEQLGAVRYADREAAARALEKLGREAIPVLELARESRDMEIRTRGAALLQKIEGSLLTTPTAVWLNFKDIPLVEAVQTLSRQTGMKIALVPENLPRWEQDHLTLQETEPLPFWKAIDRLAAAASLQAELEPQGIAARIQPAVVLTDRIRRPVYPTSDHGPFRISLVKLEFQRSLEFAPTLRFRANPAQPPGGPAARPAFTPPQPRPITNDQFSVQFQITAEPRMSISQSGAVQILEASDNLGNSLRMLNPGSQIFRTSGELLGGACSSVLHLGAALNRPEHPGRTIKVLRGSVPLRITARHPGPLIVPLAASTGKTAENGDLHLQVHEIRFDPNTHQRQIDLTIRESRSGGIPTADEEPVVDLGARFDPHQQNIEILDAHGQLVPWFQTTTDLESSRITLSLPGSVRTEPKELRYYRLSETSINVPFSFSNVPMP